MANEIDKLHPILDEVTNTITELYRHQGDEETRQKLIQMEKELQLQLKRLRENSSDTKPK